MSRINKLATDAAAAGKKLLIPYLVAGDPDLPTTLALMHELVGRGADIIELGIPFSDPSSDGPVIQRGVERALEKGTTLKQVLALVSEFRERDNTTGIVLMGYLNPIEIMGYAAFVETARAAGVDGVLTVDLPPTEASELHALLRDNELDSIFLVAPTTNPRRLVSIIEHCSGYLYYVSLKGVTGAALIDHESVRENIEKLRGRTELPIVVGFGIKDGASAAAMGALADGVIIGSALVEKIASLSGQSAPNAEQLSEATEVIGEAREALDKIV